ncbi:MAG: GNAT family N-acetyltransferase [bacterium]|nr:GNAT family N-acetyltransferase [bacterium]
MDELILRRIAEVSPENLADFTCGSPSLDDFLKEQALVYDQAGLTLTTIVFVEDDPQPVAYFSLSGDNLKLSSTERLELSLNFEVPIKSFPSVKITRLAVATKFQSAGIGAYLIELVEGIVFESSVAARLLTVDADNNERTLNFYTKLKFVESLENAKNRENIAAQKKIIEKPETISMYKDIYLEE